MIYVQAIFVLFFCSSVQANSDFIKLTLTQYDATRISTSTIVDSENIPILEHHKYTAKDLKELLEDYSVKPENVDYLMGFSFSFSLFERVKSKSPNMSDFKRRLAVAISELKINLPYKINSTLVSNYVFSRMSLAPQAQLKSSLSRFAMAQAEKEISRLEKISDADLQSEWSDPKTMVEDLIIVGVKDLVKEGKALLLIRTPGRAIRASNPSAVFPVEVTTSYYPPEDSIDELDERKEEVFLFMKGIPKISSFNYLHFAGDFDNSVFKAPEYWQINSEAFKALMQTRKQDVYFVLDDLGRILPSGGAVVVKITPRNEIIVDYKSRGGSNFQEGMSVYFAHQFRRLSVYLGLERTAENALAPEEFNTDYVAGLSVTVWKKDLSEFVRRPFSAEWAIHGELSGPTGPESETSSRPALGAGSRVGLHW